MEIQEAPSLAQAGPVNSLAGASAPVEQLRQENEVQAARDHASEVGARFPLPVKAPGNNAQTGATRALLCDHHQLVVSGDAGAVSNVRSQLAQASASALQGGRAG